MNSRKVNEILDDIKVLIFSKGYIYTLCMIIYEDFHVIITEIHEVDFRSRLSKNEVSLLIAFLIQKEIDFSTPDEPQTLLKQKDATYELMRELHNSLMLPVLTRLEFMNLKSINIDFKSLYHGDDMFIEPIFYANDGVYDFQYSDFLEKKYKYDKDWLRVNKNFDIDNSKKILQSIKNIFKTKRKNVDFFSLKEKLPNILEKLSGNNSNENSENNEKEFKSVLEFFQYRNLFFESSTDDSKFNTTTFPDLESFPEKGWNIFYKNLIELFVVRKEDFEKGLNIDSFFNNFSLKIHQNKTNINFTNIGDYNLFNSCPVIQLDNERYFIPVTFMLYEACYESPYYWMTQDDTYKNTLAKNRGNTGEEISYEFLSKVFGQERTFKSVKIIKNGEVVTDIDVLCVLGSKALCVQVKSKKLTELSKKGNYFKLTEDFNKAVQEAFNQGIVSRKSILDKNAKFYGELGSLINLPDEIDEVYILGITSENYKSLTHQASILLNKAEEDPYPVFMTVFDLEIVTHYINDPYDLLYYIRQRTTLMDYFKADTELVYLGYHLDKKLSKLEEYNFIGIDSDYGGIIDRNYYPLRTGLKISDKGDGIKNLWKNIYFDILCKHLKESNEPKVIDIIFSLLDWSSESREKLVTYIDKVKKKTLKDGKTHSFSMYSDYKDTNENLGITYMSYYNNDSIDLLNNLSKVCNLRKYKGRSNIWIGLGSIRGSSKMMDVYIYNNDKWVFDSELEQIVKNNRNDKKSNTVTAYKKINRNAQCICGSGLKYKKCCGK